MRILTVGDSFTYGEELDDLTNAWPTLLAQKLNYSLTNLAIPGGGNNQMVRKVIENYQEYDLIIIAWSHYARIEFADEHGIYDTWPGHLGRSFINSLEYRHKLIEYINRHHNDRYLYNQYLNNIILLQNFLKQQTKQYIMLDSFGNNNSLRAARLSNKIVNQLDLTYYIGWPNESMMDWTFNTPMGPGGHFLEEGHAKVADKIYEHIRHLGWVS